MSYFDNNATTPMHSRALDALLVASRDQWRNPSSPYRNASRTKAMLSRAREEWGENLGIEASKVTFTSGSTESNNQVIAWAARNHPHDARIVISGLEHPRVYQPAKQWFGDRVQVVPHSSSGAVCMQAFEEMVACSPSPALVCMMAASNESGILQPWQDAAKLCADLKIPFHCDSTQWVGKMPVSDLKLCSSFTASAHKFGGPKGVGWLVDANGSFLQSGGSQEGGRRAGTENFPSIESMRIAWEETRSGLSDAKNRASWRDQFESALLAKLPGLRVVGGDAERLWNTSFLLMPKFDNLKWIGKLERLGFEVSTGSACSTGSLEPSPSTRAHSLDSSESKRLLRVSSFLSHTQEDWMNLADAILRSWEELAGDSQPSNVISV